MSHLFSKEANNDKTKPQNNPNTQDTRSPRSSHESMHLDELKILKPALVPNERLNTEHTITD